MKNKILLILSIAIVFAIGIWQFGQARIYNPIDVVSGITNGVFDTITTNSTTATSTFKGAVQIGGTTGINLFKLVAGQNYGGGTEVPGDGAVNITNTSNDDLAFQIYTNNGTTANAPLALLRSNNSAFDDGILWLLQAGTAGGAYNIKNQGPAPQIEWVETDQTTPAGKFEDGINGDIRYIASRNSADNSFENAFTFGRLANGGSFAQLGTGNSYFTGNLGISTTTPQSLLQIETPLNATSSYLQLDVLTSAPAAGDCNSETEIGRMIMASTTARYLWTCWGTAGWATSTITL